VNNITQLLANAEQGAPLAAEELVPAVYDELRRLAGYKMAHELPGQTLQPTALVHEAWLRLGADAQPNWKSRGHFFFAAAEAMRRILVERARRHAALKRGAGSAPVSLDEVEIAIETPEDDERLLKVDEALEKFCAMSPRKGELVKLRYFVGMTFEEAASVLDIAVPTAKEWWAYARAWLGAELRDDLPP
jgi:RNA polymerase sigma factor (TIGR02999 family)